MIIEKYSGKYDEQIINLILNIQNNESRINLSLDEQPDLKEIEKCYQLTGGEFWIALEGETVIGTIGLMLKNNNCAILKKFFVLSEYRNQKIGLKLYNCLLDFAKSKGVKHIILDTPSVAHASHRFYERSGFYKINHEELPVEYSFPDRDSLLYMLDL